MYLAAAFSLDKIEYGLVSHCAVELRGEITATQNKPATGPQKTEPFRQKRGLPGMITYGEKIMGKHHIVRLALPRPMLFTHINRIAFK
jgi:hypothetical protein